VRGMEASWKKCEIPDQKSPMPLFYKGLRDCVSPVVSKIAKALNVAIEELIK